MHLASLDPSSIRDLSSLLLDEKAHLRVVPAETLRATTREERILFGVRHGLYALPTLELCDFLIRRIAGRSAIEIGAGHGAMSRHLGLRATDNYQQDDPQIKAYYQLLRQTTVPYGAHVEKLDAAAAVQKYRPSVVVACWVTHRFNPNEPEREGNQSGVDEAEIIAHCDEYIFIGNEKVHAAKPIWNLPHQKITPPWVYSRAGNGSKDFIAIWKKEQCFS